MKWGGLRSDTKIQLIKISKVEPVRDWFSYSPCSLLNWFLYYFQESQPWHIIFQSNLGLFGLGLAIIFFWNRFESQLDQRRESDFQEYKQITFFCLCLVRRLNCLSHYVSSTQVKWPSGKEARFWSVQLDSLLLWLADKISCLVCQITIQLNPAEQTKSAPPHQKAI